MRYPVVVGVTVSARGVPAHVAARPRRKAIDIHTDWRGSLVRAGTLSAYGNDYGVLYGITCSVAGSRHLVTEHGFYIKFGTHSWMRQDTIYAWQGPALKVFALGPARRMRGAPPPALVGVRCGHPPRLAAASESQGARPWEPRRTVGEVPAGAAPASVSFVSSSTAFVLGSAPCARAPCKPLVGAADSATHRIRPPHRGLDGGGP